MPWTDFAISAALASSQADAGANAAASAIDDDDGSKWTSNATATGTLRLTMASSVTATAYRILPSTAASQAAFAPKSWTFEGSNDGTTFTTLDTRTNVAWETSSGTLTQWLEFTFTNSTAYAYYRLNVSANQGGAYLAISRIWVASGARDSIAALGSGQIVQWHAADAITGVSDGASLNATSIPDSSGNGHALTTSVAIGKYRSNTGPNSMPFMDGSTTSGVAYNTASVVPPMNDLTYFGVVKRAGTSSDGILGGIGSGAARVRIDSSGHLQLGKSGISEVAASSTLTLASGAWAWFIVKYTASSGSTAFIVNGTTETIAGTSGGGFAGPLVAQYIGDESGVLWHGGIAEVGAYRSVLGSTDTTTLSDYLVNKFFPSAILGVAALSSGSALTSGAALTRLGGLALTEGSTLTSGATTFSGESAALVAGSTLTVTAEVTVLAAAALSSTSTLTAAPDITGTVALTSGSALVATATGVGELMGVAAMSSVSTLVVAATTTGFTGTLAFSMTAGVAVAYAGGGLGSPLALPASVVSVDFGAGVDTGDPTPVDGAATSVDLWYVFTSSSSSDWTFVWTGVGVGMEVWAYPGGIGVIDPAQMTLIASSATGTLAVPLGQDIQYLLRIHPLSTADNAATGSLSYVAVGRAGSGTLQLQILTTVVDTPAWLQSSVTNATDSGVLDFTLDGGSTVIFTDTADLAGQLILSSILLEVLTVGAHTLTVTDATSTQSATAGFAVVDLVGTPTSVAATAAPSAAVTPRWQLFDPHPGGELYAMAINPTQMTSPHSVRVMATDHTTDPLGQPIVFEGLAVAQGWTLTGTVFLQSQVDAFERFHGLQRRFWVIDHLMRAWLVTWESLEWAEVRDISNPVTYAYTAKLLIYEDREAIAL